MCKILLRKDIFRLYYNNIPGVKTSSSAVDFTEITTELQEMGKRTFDTWMM